MNAYINMSSKQIAANFRAAYANHQALAHAYAEGGVDSEELRNSANNLKALRAAYAAECEANQVRKH